MLGWVLRRGQDAPGDEDGDTLQLEQPETPAPVFAARAFKSALFGSPGKTDNSKPPGTEVSSHARSKAITDKAQSKPKNPPKQGTSKSTTTTTTSKTKNQLTSKNLAQKPSHATIQIQTTQTASKRSEDAAAASGPDTPTKPPGILLTPGTGTSRRKRVSFGQDVLDTDNELDDPSSPSSLPRRSHRMNKSPDRLQRFRSGRSQQPPPPPPLSSENRKRGSPIKIRRNMHNSTHNPPVALYKNETPADNIVETSESDTNAVDEEYDDTEDEYEDKEDDDDADSIDSREHCQHDVTLDLNEPHSQSGKYWKSNFERYHEDAKAEMEKLLKYKQLAKTYAQRKDEEASAWQERLVEERTKVAEMEKKITEMAAEMAANRAQKGTTDSDGDDGTPMHNLARQTALAVQYKAEVKDLEAMMQRKKNQAKRRSKQKRKHNDGNSAIETSSETEDEESDDDSEAETLQHALSPRTYTTLLETQKELRKARSQLHQIDSLQSQITSLQTDLRKSRERQKREEARADELQKQLDEARETSRQKDETLHRVQREYREFRKEAEATTEQYTDLLRKSNEKSRELRQEVKDLREANARAVATNATVTAKTNAISAMSSGALDSRPKSYSARVQEAEDGTVPIYVDETENLDEHTTNVVEDAPRPKISSQGNSLKNSSSSSSNAISTKSSATTSSAPAPLSTTSLSRSHSTSGTFPAKLKHTSSDSARLDAAPNDPRPRTRPGMVGLRDRFQSKSQHGQHESDRQTGSDDPRRRNLQMDSRHDQDHIDLTVPLPGRNPDRPQIHYEDACPEDDTMQEPLAHTSRPSARNKRHSTMALSSLSHKRQAEGTHKSSRNTMDFSQMSSYDKTMDLLDEARQLTRPPLRERDDILPPSARTRRATDEAPRNHGEPLPRTHEEASRGGRSRQRSNSAVSRNTVGSQPGDENRYGLTRTSSALDGGVDGQRSRHGRQHSLGEGSPRVDHGDWNAGSRDRERDRDRDNKDGKHAKDSKSGRRGSVGKVSDDVPTSTSTSAPQSTLTQIQNSVVEKIQRKRDRLLQERRQRQQNLTAARAEY